MGRGTSRLGVPSTIDGKTNPEYQRLYRAEEERICLLWRVAHLSEYLCLGSRARNAVLTRVWQTFLKSGEEAALAEPVVKEEQ